jgi:hypothetical protein
MYIDPATFAKCLEAEIHKLFTSKDHNLLKAYFKARGIEYKDNETIVDSFGQETVVKINYGAKSASGSIIIDIDIDQAD